MPAAGAPARDEPAPGWPGVAGPPENSSGEVRFPAEDGGQSLARMAQRDLTATLQLLVERAQYITGSTGAAIALRDGEDMLCRASAGTSAPEVGAQLQVNSGLSGESVRTRQTLRCDDALTDERVNRESCEALGIRSVVVMPLLQGDQVIGVFELFSDKANIFEARDITALERMGSMVHTALEHSAAATGVAAEPAEAEAVQPPPAEAPEADSAVKAAPDLLPHSVPDPALSAEVPQEIVQGSAGDALLGRVEEKAAATLGSTSGITFHRRVPASAPPNSGAPNPLEKQEPVPEISAEIMNSRPVESPAQASAAGVEAEAPVAQGEAPSENADVLEMPVEVSIPELTHSVAGDEVLDPAIVGQAPESGEQLPEAKEAEKSEPLKPPSNLAVGAVGSESVAGSGGPVANLRKCEACGFPVSEGRQLCLDCERKGLRIPARETAEDQTVMPAPAVTTVRAAEVSEMLNFLAGEEKEASWLATHRLMVIAMVIAVIVIIVLMLAR